jgi:hypothetical protein
MLFDTPRLVSKAVLVGLVVRQIGYVRSQNARQDVLEKGARYVINVLPFF